VLGLLGPNGAGKTTTVRILTALLKPDGGSAHVAGVDVVADPQGVRRKIGLSGQYAAVDENLTGFENLRMVGRLYGLSASDSTARARELLGDFRLDDAAERAAKTYSGGMRRRLDLAGALVARPSVVVLDVPLTTQYLEEADQLAHSIAVIDSGKVIATGTADELKRQVGGERLEIEISERADIAGAQAVLARLGTAEPSMDSETRRLGVTVEGGSASLVEALRQLDAAGIKVLDVALRRPTLDDVFLSLTGHAAEAADAEEEQK